jgi:hypothetical protein
LYIDSGIRVGRKQYAAEGTLGGEMQATEESVLGVIAQMPSVEHLLSGSLDVLREAIGRVSAEDEPTRWVVSHIILGSALRLRAASAPEDERMHMYIEALNAFEVALAACCEKKLVAMREQGSTVALNTPGARRHVQAGPDGVQLVVEASALTGTEGNEMLERAIRIFREACAKANRRMLMEDWFIGMSNLGCALTLLGCRTPGPESVPLLEEAVDVFQEALRMPVRTALMDERASAQANLSEALESLAERSMPSESLRYLEQAADWRATALCHFAPREHRWLLQLDRGRPS